MKKWILTGTLIVALAVVAVFAWVGVAYARWPHSLYHHGYGMMGSYGMMRAWDDAPMHPYMLDALAGALNLTPEEIQVQIDQGDTPYQIAQSQGLSRNQARRLVFAAHDEALDEAVQAGALTQEQANWMDRYMESTALGGFRGCPGFNGFGGHFGPMMGGRW